MFVVGVTGGIGSGKSTAAKLIGSWGIPVFDADKISHEVTEAGGKAIPRVAEAFGPEVLLDDGSLDREAMGRVVFNDRKELDRLSLIVHEEVMGRLAELSAESDKAGEKAVVLDVPIPVEKGFRDTCDYILVVRCDEEIRLERLANRGMDRQEARRRMAMQMTDEEYSALATETINNNGTIEELEEALRRTIGEALEMRGIRIPEQSDPKEEETQSESV